MIKNQIVVIGIGYVGLVSAVCLAELGHTVICVDIDPKKIDFLSQGAMTIYEPGIKELLHNGLNSKRLRFTTSYSDAFAQAPFCVIIAVDTPTGTNGACDLSRVDSVLQAIGHEISSDIAIIMKSTVPVGTNKYIDKKISEELALRQKEHLRVDVISNPEFLREGAALNDFMHADRIIVGIRNERSEEIMRSLYAPLLERSNKTDFVVMDPESSELTKYAANTMLATRISFMNWLAEIAEKSGADIEAVRKGIGSDRRIGPAFLQAGLGFGGSCFPKDIAALEHVAKTLDVDASLITAVRQINASQRIRLAERLVRSVPPNSTICIWGLAFKPNTDDMREAPAIDIIKILLENGLRVRLFDPVAMPQAQKLLYTLPWYNDEQAFWAETPLEAASEADALMLVTEWPLFGSIDIRLLRKAMKRAVIFDGRNMFEPEEIALFGFEYHSVGRAAVFALPTAEESSCARTQAP